MEPNESSPASPTPSPAKSRYSRATLEAVHRIEQIWKGMEDTDRTILCDSIEQALGEATDTTADEARADFQTVLAIFSKYAV